MPIKQLSFHVIVEKVEGGFVANCLETGVIATSTDERDAISKIGKLIDRHVEFAIKHGRLRDVFVPAPQAVFQKFLNLNDAVLRQSSFASPIESDDSSLTVNQLAYA